MRHAGGLLLLAMLGGCESAPVVETNKQEALRPSFPAADRPVAKIVSAGWSSEEKRDQLKEATKVMDRAGIEAGMTVADIGAGEGYYTIRLAQRVGAKGRVLAEDILPSYRDALAQRVSRERLDNVSVRLGEPANPKLPDASFDRVMMVRMYHEIESPYEFLWNMRPAVKPDGLVVVVDADRPTQDRGTPKALLQCEFAAVGYVLVEQHDMPSAEGYIATFRPRGPRPDPQAIVPCRTARS